MMMSETPALKKSLGQHFLKSASISRKIVSLLQPEKKDNIIEIGPGAGALTGQLENVPHSRLLLIEKDCYWAEQRKLAGGENTKVLNMDALTMEWASFCADANWKIIGNLPYNVASPLIWDILSQCNCLQIAVFMVQKEVGLRLCARAGNKNYGALTVWAQSYAQIKLEFSVGPGAFSPPPKVDSAVLTFKPITQDLRPKNPEKLNNLLKLCFQNRRKQLGGIFRRAQKENLLAGLDELQISHNLRPENLLPGQFQQLSLYWQ